MKTPKPVKRTIDDEISHIVNELAQMSVDSKEYESAAHNLEILCKARNARNEHKVSPDSIVMAVTNILGIVLILNYERFNVISSKTLGLLMRGRV